MVQGTSQIALIYRVYYKCMRTNMNVGALDRREKGQTTLIQTTDPTAKVSIPRSLRSFLRLPVIPWGNNPFLDTIKISAWGAEGF